MASPPSFRERPAVICVLLWDNSQEAALRKQLKCWIWLQEGLASKSFPLDHNLAITLVVALWETWRQSSYLRHTWVLDITECEIKDLSFKGSSLLRQVSAETPKFPLPKYSSRANLLQHCEKSFIKLISWHRCSSWQALGIRFRNLQSSQLPWMI